MRKRLSYLPLFLIGIICSCSSPVRKKITVDSIAVGKLKNNSLPFSDVYDDYELIKLETSESNLIKKIDKIKYEDEKFFILSNKTIQIYSSNGAFISSVDRKGAGEGEYISISDFHIDMKHLTIEVNDYNKKKIITYDWQGHYISEWKHNLLIDKFYKLNDNQYVFYCMSFLNEEYSRRILFVDKEKNEVVNSCFDISTNEAWYLYISDMTNFISTDDNNYFMYSQNDTIYSIVEDDLQAYKVIDFSDESISTDYYNMKHDNIFEFMQALKKKSFVGLIDNYHDTDKIITFTARKQDKLHQVFYDKVLNRSKSTKYLIDDMIFIGHKREVSFDFCPVLSDNENLYYSMQAYSIIEVMDSLKGVDSKIRFKPQVEELYQDISFSDNPCLLKMHIKK